MFNPSFLILSVGSKFTFLGLIQQRNDLFACVYTIWIQVGRAHRGLLGELGAGTVTLGYEWHVTLAATFSGAIGDSFTTSLQLR